jgi:basic membrane protein A and related proteins
MKSVSHFMKSMVAVCLLIAVFSFEDAQVTTPGPAKVAFANAATTNAARAVKTPDAVIALRFAEGGWKNSDNNALWEGTLKALREAQSDAVDVIVYDAKSPLPVAANLVLATGEAYESIQTQAQHHPDVQFVLLDSPSTLRRNNLKTVTFADLEISYLLGYLAGSLSQTGILGFVGDSSVKTLSKQAAFYQGVMMACQRCKLESAFVESSQDTVKAKSLTQTLQQKGADIVYAEAGEASQGVVDFVNESQCFSNTLTRPSPLSIALTSVSKGIDYLSSCPSGSPLFFMGAGRFQPELGDTDSDMATLNHGLSSVAKRINLAAYESVRAFLNDTLTAGHEQRGLEDGGVDIAVNDYNRALLPSEVLSQIEALKAQIIAGELVIETP